MQLRDKVIVVTGASAGLGRNLALEAGRRGAKVALLARRKSRLQESAKIITSEGGEALVLSTDIGDPAAVRRAFQKIQATWQTIQVLFNNAAVLQPISPLIRSSDEALLTSLKTNMFGLYLVTREALAIMMPQAQGGTIVNITSGAAEKPYEGWSAYCSQKAAMNMFTRCIAKEVAAAALRIFAVVPGSFESHMQQSIRSSSIEDFPAREKFIGLHRENRLAKPETLAKVLLDISLSEWPELSGTIQDIRSDEFQKQCLAHHINIP